MFIKINYFCYELLELCVGNVNKWFLFVLLSIYVILLINLVRG